MNTRAHAAPRARRRRKEPLQARLVEQIRASILAGRLRPGDPVPESHLARQHGVSQATVREALLRLEHAGLVRRIHNIGTFVTQMSPREIRERLRLRVMLEGLAAQEATRRAQPSQHEELDRRLKAISEAVAANNYFAAAEADLELHRYVWECSGDTTLYQILDQLTVPLFAFVSMERRRRRENLTDAVQAHDPIVRALKARDAAAVQEALRVHIKTSYAEFLGSAQGYGLSVSNSLREVEACTEPVLR